MGNPPAAASNPLIELGPRVAPTIGAGRPPGLTVRPGGAGGIRTLEGVAPLRHFQCRAIGQLGGRSWLHLDSTGDCRGHWLRTSVGRVDCGTRQPRRSPPKPIGSAKGARTRAGPKCGWLLDHQRWPPPLDVLGPCPEIGYRIDLGGVGPRRPESGSFRECRAPSAGWRDSDRAGGRAAGESSWQSS